MGVASMTGPPSPAAASDVVMAPVAAGAFQISTLAQLLAEAGRSMLADTVAGQSLDEWMSAFQAGRPAFLKSLVGWGITRLADRQAIANTIGKAMREGRLRAES